MVVVERVGNAAMSFGAGRAVDELIFAARVVRAFLGLHLVPDIIDDVLGGNNDSLDLGSLFGAILDPVLDDGLHIVNPGLGDVLAVLLHVRIDFTLELVSSVLSKFFAGNGKFLELGEDCVPEVAEHLLAVSVPDGENVLAQGLDGMILMVHDWASGLMPEVTHGFLKTLDCIAGFVEALSKLLDEGLGSVAEVGVDVLKGKMRIDP